MSGTWEGAPAPHDFRDHKAHMQWKLDVAKNSTVPLIPQDLSEGSQSSALSSTVMQRAAANPFVPIGMLATVGCLVGMMSSTLNRNSKRAQLYMRGRCLAQGITVAALVAGVFMFDILCWDAGMKDTHITLGLLWSGVDQSSSYRSHVNVMPPKAANTST